MGDKWNAIKAGTVFKANGVSYRKVDDLAYESLDNPGIETYNNPAFEATIGVEPRKPVNVVDTTPKFIVDPNTRVMKPNPDYMEPGAKAMDELWGSAEFDCGPEDYEYMVTESVAAVRAIKDLAKATNMPLTSTSYPTIVALLSEYYLRGSSPRVRIKGVVKKLVWDNDAYTVVEAPPSPLQKAVKKLKEKKAVKKAAKKSAAKRRK